MTSVLDRDFTFSWGGKAGGGEEKGGKEKRGGGPKKEGSVSGRVGGELRGEGLGLGLGLERTGGIPEGIRGREKKKLWAFLEVESA